MKDDEPKPIEPTPIKYGWMPLDYFPILPFAYPPGPTFQPHESTYVDFRPFPHWDRSVRPMAIKIDQLWEQVNLLFLYQFLSEFIRDRILDRDALDRWADDGGANSV